MKEDKATQYVNQKMMPHLINQQSMAEKPLFTSLDLKAAYEAWHDIINNKFQNIM